MMNKYYLLLGVFVVGIFIGMAIPDLNVDYKARSELIQSISAIDSQKKEIERHITETKTVIGSGYKIDLPQNFQKSNIDYLHITYDGVIILRQSDYGQTITMIPAYNESGIVWSCVGSPKKDVPIHCQGKLKKAE